MPISNHFLNGTLDDNRLNIHYAHFKFVKLDAALFILLWQHKEKITTKTLDQIPHFLQKELYATKPP